MKRCTCSHRATRHGVDDYGRLHRGRCLACECPVFVDAGDVVRKIHPRIFVAGDGHPMMVIRPSTEEGKRHAIRAAAESLVTQVPLTEPPADDYFFAGYLARDMRTVVDRDGRTLGEIEPGDSLVTEREPPN